MINVLSLGAGVQSSTLALMAAKGEIPMPDCAIFADTEGEPNEVYIWLDWLIGQLPYPVYKVTKGSLEEKTIKLQVSKISKKRYMSGKIPAFVLSPEGNKGLLGRSCTADYKIRPVVSKIRDLLGLKQVRSKEVLVNQWMGISTDEASRMKPSREAWIKHEYPLIERNMSRNDCFEWMEKNGYPVPPRSSCLYCPFHSDDEWLRIKTDMPDEFEQIIKFEKRLQINASQCEILKGVPYLHGSCEPIGSIDFKKIKPKKKEQLDMFDNECEGMCGL